MIQTLPQTELSQSPDLLRHIPPTAIPASRLVSSDQLPRRAGSRNPTSGNGAEPTISCPYYKSELYIVSEEQAFRSQHGRPFRNADVADCVAVASSTPPSVMVPHRSFLRTPAVTVGGLVPGSNVDSQHPDLMMRHSYYGSVLPSCTSVSAMSSTAVAASASSLPSVQRNWPSDASRRSMTESKWKWLHSNAMMPEQSSPVSLRRATRLDIPSSAQLSSSALCPDTRQQSAGSLSTPLGNGRLADPRDQSHASRLYYSKPVVDSSGPAGEQPPHRKTTMDLIQSVTDVHRSVGDQSIRHWRHSSDNTARRSTTDPSSRKWDNYGLTLSLSGAAVPLSGNTLGNGAKKLDLDRSTNDHVAASSTGVLPQKLPIERIMRFETADVVDSVGYHPSSSRHPKDVAAALHSRCAFEDIASRTARQSEPDSASARHSISGENALPSVAANSGRSGRMSIPDSIPIYFRAEPSATQSQLRSSRVKTEAGRGDSKTVQYSTDGPREQSSFVTSSQPRSCGMYIVALVTISTVCFTVCNIILML